MSGADGPVSSLAMTAFGRRQIPLLRDQQQSLEALPGFFGIADGQDEMSAQSLEFEAVAILNEQQVARNRAKLRVVWCSAPRTRDGTSAVLARFLRSTAVGVTVLPRGLS